MSTIDEYVQELIRAQEEQIARKIYQETIIPYLMKIQAEPKSEVENGWPQPRADEEEPNRWPLDPEDVVVEYLGNNGSASGGSECAGTYPVSGYTRLMELR